MSNDTNRFELFFGGVKRRVRPLVAVVSILVLGVLAVELTSFTTLTLYRAVTSGEEAEDDAAPDPRQHVDVYDGEDWAQAYYEEFDASYATRYQPYTEYRRVPFSGRYINVDSAGIRRTVPDCGSGQPDALRVFFLGGSAAWGTGARDEATIPSHLTRKLCEGGIPTTTTNFGESGYTSTQELFQLQLELRAGRVPDIVIFYDGVNDVYSTYQNRIPGLPQNVRDRMQPKPSAPATRPGRLRRIAGLTYTGELARALASRIRHVATRPEPAWEAPEGADATRLERQTVELMLANAEIVRALQNTYDFHTFFYWQPAVYTKAVHSDDERHAIPKDTAYGQMYRRVTDLIRRQDMIVDLSDTFDDEPNSVFFDEFHISERGNERVADAILEDVLEHLEIADDARLVVEDY